MAKETKKISIKSTKKGSVRTTGKRKPKKAQYNKVIKEIKVPQKPSGNASVKKQVAYAQAKIFKRCVELLRDQGVGSDQDVAALTLIATTEVTDAKFIEVDDIDFLCN